MNSKFFNTSTFGLILLLLVFVSCLNEDKTEDPYKRLTKEVKAIDDYLTTMGITPIKDVSGVRMVITQLGTGLPATVKSKINIDYVGKLFSTGATFDQGNVNDVLEKYIDGWKIAFTTLPAGSKATLYIPSGYGYGNRDNSSIPANSILQFDVNFKDVEETTAELNRLKEDTLAIDDYITDKGIENVVIDDSGLRYTINQEGTGSSPFWYTKVKIKYTIKLLTDDTKVVATVEREPSTEFASRVIDYIHGLKIGLQKMEEGGKATFYIPSGLGFGTVGASDGASLVVPANANLIVDLELIDIVE